MDFLVAPVARALGAARWAAVEPVVEDGVFTGGLREPLCIDDGKVHWASTLARELGVRLDECTLYTDDVGDVPLLELVGEPVAVNPDPRLRRVAGRRGWRVLEFAGRGRADRAAAVSG
jgi:phosphoserine phosphatase